MGELRTLYNVRSSIEHLSGAFAALEGPDDYKHWRVDWHLIRAEAIARHILRTIFLEPALWHSFATEQTLEQFCYPSRRANRRTLLGKKVFLDHVTVTWDKRKPPEPLSEGAIPSLPI